MAAGGSTSQCRRVNLHDRSERFINGARVHKRLVLKDRSERFPGNLRPGGRGVLHDPDRGFFLNEGSEGLDDRLRLGDFGGSGHRSNGCDRAEAFRVFVGLLLEGCRVEVGHLFDHLIVADGQGVAGQVLKHFLQWEFAPP